MDHSVVVVIVCGVVFHQQSEQTHTNVGANRNTWQQQTDDTEVTVYHTNTRVNSIKN